MHRTRVRFRDRTWSLNLPKESRVEDVKKSVSALANIPEFRITLIFAGKILEGTGTVTLTEGATLVVTEIPEEFSVNVRGTGISPFDVKVALTDTVLDLKQKIEATTAVAPDAQVLVAKGAVLRDELTLAFYNMRPNLPIFVKTKSTAQTARLANLIERLFELMNDFITANDSRRAVVSEEISKLIEEPYLVAYAKIHSRTARLIDESRFLVEEFRYTANDRLSRAFWEMQDVAMAQYESSADGIRLLQEAMESEENEDILLEPKYPTNTDYKTEMLTEKLPACWGLFCFDDAGEKQFARQISVLKKMGFTDENQMLKALKETSGNVPQAAKIIFYKFSHE